RGRAPMSLTPSSRPGRRPDPALRLKWQQRLESFESSGLSAPDFCSREGLTLTTFHSWRRRLRPSVSGPERCPPLLPVVVAPSSSVVEVVLPTGLVLRLPPGADLDFIRSLVSVLGGGPC